MDLLKLIIVVFIAAEFGKLLAPDCPKQKVWQKIKQHNKEIATRYLFTLNGLNGY